MPFYEIQGDCHQNASVGSVSNRVAALSATKSRGAIASMLVPWGNGKSNDEGIKISTFRH
jgi:hypothetical protein